MSPQSVYLDFAEAIERLGRDVVADRYGNLFAMYEEIIDDDPYKTPMMIYPAPHYTMGGLWVDYNLESTIPGLFVAGETNFSDHGANRLGASALMQAAPTATSWCRGWWPTTWPRAASARRASTTTPSRKRKTR